MGLCKIHSHNLYNLCSYFHMLLIFIKVFLILQIPLFLYLLDVHYDLQAHLSTFRIYLLIESD